MGTGNFSWINFVKSSIDHGISGNWSGVLGGNRGLTWPQEPVAYTVPAPAKIAEPANCAARSLRLANSARSSSGIPDTAAASATTR